MIKWLWEIVLEEWSDDKRRKLLTFSTGSDRAPVNGLKSLKFYIIKDGQDDKRLPSSHNASMLKVVVDIMINPDQPGVDLITS